MRMKRFHRVILLLIFAVSASPQGRKEKKEARLEESAKPKNVVGGVKFEVRKSYQDSYEAILNWVKRAEYTIDSADKETGQIITAMTVTGGYSQTGTRVMFTLVKESDATTTVKVAVTEQKRKKLLSVEPWSEPKINDKDSQALAEKIKIALQ